MRQAILGGMLAVLAIAPGCTKALEQGYYTATGATPRYFEVKDLGGSTVLDAYKTVGVEPFDASPMLGAIPPLIVPEVQADIAQTLTATRMFATVIRGAPPRGGLLIRGRFVDYDPGEGVVRTLGFGEYTFLTARIELVDTGANQLLGVAMVSGTAKSALRKGPKELAEGLARAVEGLLKRHHTKVPEKAEGRAAAPAPAKKQGFRWPWE